MFKFAQLIRGRADIHADFLRHVTGYLTVGQAVWVCTCFLLVPPGEEEYLRVPTGVWSGHSAVDGQRFAVLVFRDVRCEPAGLWPSGKVGVVLKKEGSGVFLPPGTTLWKDRGAPFGDTGD